MAKLNCKRDRNGKSTKKSLKSSKHSKNKQKIFKSGLIESNRKKNQIVVIRSQQNPKVRQKKRKVPETRNLIQENPYQKNKQKVK